MKKHLFGIFFLICLQANAQPGCNWAYIPQSVSQTYHNIYHSITDHSGNIITCGRVTGIADLDPGALPTDTSFSASGFNYYLAKTSVAGKLLWVKYFKYTGFFECMGLKVNSDNAIIVAGNFYGLLDFDLSPNGVDTVRSHFPTYPDYFLAKYDSLGTYDWEINIGDVSVSNTIELKAMTLLPNGQIAVSVNPTGVLDVDPGPAVHNTMGGNANLVVYDSNGNYLWNNHISTTYSYAIPNASLAADGAGNIYQLSVGYYEMTVNKYDDNGNFLWSKKIGDFANSARVTPQTILVDEFNGGFFVAGTFGGTVDFDPGISVTAHASSSGFFQDGFIAGYDSSMQLQWINPYAGNVSFGTSALAFSGNEIVAVGSLTGNINFGNAVTLASSLSLSPFMLRLSSGGLAQNAFVLNGVGKINTVALCDNQLLAVTGYITSNTDMDPGTASLILSANTSSYFTAVYESATTTALSEASHHTELKVYPNPAQGVLYVEFDEPAAELTVTNPAGQEIRHLTIEEGLFQLEGLAQGLYLIQLKTSQSMRSFKIVVQ